MLSWKDKIRETLFAIYGDDEDSWEQFKDDNDKRELRMQIRCINIIIHCMKPDRRYKS